MAVYPLSSLDSPIHSRSLIKLAYSRVMYLTHTCTLYSMHISTPLTPNTPPPPHKPPIFLYSHHLTTTPFPFLYPISTTTQSLLASISLNHSDLPLALFLCTSYSIRLLGSPIPNHTISHSIPNPNHTKPLNTKSLPLPKSLNLES